MRDAIPRRSLRRALWAASLTAWLLACSHTGEEDRLVGYWEGTLPLPSTGQDLPIAYDFRAGNGLTVTVGLGQNRTVTEWERWEVHSAEDGDIVVHIHRGDGRVFATLVRHRGDDQLMLWDLGTDESSAAHVRRVPRRTQGGRLGSGENAGGD